MVHAARHDPHYRRRVRVLWVGVLASTVVVVGIWALQFSVMKRSWSKEPSRPSRFGRELESLRAGLEREWNPPAPPAPAAAVRAAGVIEFQDATLKQLSTELNSQTQPTTKP